MAIADNKVLLYICGYENSRCLLQRASGDDLFRFLLGLLGQKDSLDVGEDTTGGDGHSVEKLVQFLIVANGQLKVTWDDPRLLVITGSVASQLQDLSGQVLEYGCQVDWGTASNSRSVVSFPQVSVHTANGELKSSPEGSGLALGLSLASFSSSRHDCK